MSCPNYHYWNSTTNSCKQCYHNQEVYGIISWSIFGILGLMMCLGCNNRIIVPFVITLIIASNQTYCNREWSNGVARIVLLLDIFMLLIGTLVVYQECKFWKLMSKVWGKDSTPPPVVTNSMAIP